MTLAPRTLSVSVATSAQPIVIPESDFAECLQFRAHYGLHLRPVRQEEFDDTKPFIARNTSASATHSLAAVLTFALPSTIAQSPDFENEVAPILIRRCVECHQASNPSGNLSLESVEGLLKGGDSGAALQMSSSTNSLLFQRVEAGEMPPVKHGENQKLPPSEIETLRRWIEAGAAFPKGRRLDLYERTTDLRGGRDWWAFQPVKIVTPPKVNDPDAAANPIDAFILESLGENQFKPAPRATDEVLLRRLHWDITGLRRHAKLCFNFAVARLALTRLRPRLISCWPRRNLASGGRVIGWTWYDSRKPADTNETR